MRPTNTEPLIFGYTPKGDLRQSKVRDGHYTLRLQRKASQEIAEIFLHFEGKSVDRIRATTCWLLKEIDQRPSDKARGRFHYRAVPALGGQTPQVDEVVLRDGTPDFVKKKKKKPHRSRQMMGKGRMQLCGPAR